MKTKSRLLASVLCMLMVVAFCVVGLIACNEEQVCSHQWGEWSTTTKATCTDAGAKERKCINCGETETSAIEARGHDWKDATCTTPKTCKTCSATEGSAAPHAYTVESVKAETFKSAATCASAAVYYKSCACGAISKNDADTFTSGEMLSHVDANRDHICDNNCGTTTVGAHADSDTDDDHICDYGCGAAQIEACSDAQNDGNHHCDVCGKIEITAHTYAAATCTVPATCTECGVTTGSTIPHKDDNRDHVCDYGCGKTGMGAHADSATDADHVCDYGCGVKLEECFDTQNDGDHNCNVCGNTDISAHTYGEATCGAPATCFECGATTGSTVDHKDENHDHICDGGCGKNDMGEHTDSDTDADHICDYGCGATLESCSDADTDADHICDVCGKADVSAHSYTLDADASTQATCVSAAVNAYVCNCGDSYTETVGAALDHDISGVDPEERQMEGCQYVLVYVCQRPECGEEILGETVYHHAYVASIGTPATCTTPGQKVFKCSACGDEEKAPEEIPADGTGHNWVSDGATSGTRTDTCSICSATKTVTVYEGTTTDKTNAGNLKDTEIELNDANINLGNGLIDDVIGDQEITVSADKFEGDDRLDLNLSEGQLSQVGDNPIYNFAISTNDGQSHISKFDDNWVTITLPYKLTDGEDVDSIAIWFIGNACLKEDCPDGENCTDADHKLDSIKATYNNGFVTFKTNHFSYYTVTRLTPAQRCELYGHGYTEQVVEGSCTKDGYVLLVCVRCHDKKIKDGTLQVADGHDYVPETHAATCTENGYIINTCDDCGHSYRTKLNATGHTWSVEESVEATCKADGYTKYGCDNCDEEYTDIHKKVAHVYTDTVVLATCMADGYTLHDCNNCDYSYTDAYVTAVGHTYEPAAWSWAVDHSTATLTFACKNNAAHVMVLNATITSTVVNGTCSNFTRTTYVATVSYNDTDHSDQKVVEVGTPDHVFSTDWKQDEAAHWHECVCGEKTDVAAHTFGNETVTKPATCAQAGESIAYCACGATKVTVIPATGEHNYVNGLCAVCGLEKVECDHTKLHRASIDFGELGACDFILYYDTCQCGEVKVIDIDSSEIPCEPSDEPEINQYVDDNGNLCMSMSMTCADCGMEVSANAIYGQNGCTTSIDFDYTFKINGVVVIEHIGYEETNTWHKNTESATVDLSQYGVCGGTLVVTKCVECGEVIEIDDLNLGCNVNTDDEPVVEEVTDENGIVHSVEKMECADCGFAFVVDTWVEKISVCESITHIITTVRCGETAILVLHDEEYDETHEYEYEYELKGESCEDGVSVTTHCSICDEEYTYTSTWHNQIDEGVEIDLSEHSTCGGTVNVDRCAVCGCIIDINDMDINCDMGDEVEENITDEQGNVIGSRYKSTCSVCGLIFIEDEWVETEGTCKSTEYEGLYIYKGEECIFTYVEGWYRENHKYEYTYQFKGESCEDGYTVIAYCTVCETTNQWSSMGHKHEMFQINLSEYGCGGMVSGARCAACKEIIYLNQWNAYCELSESVPEEVVDENGITHYVTTQICPNCGLKFVTETWTTVESACVKTQHLIRKIYKDEALIFDASVQHVNENHEYEYSYEFEGDTCEDGYYVNVSCPVCGENDRYYSSGHRNEWREISLEELGLCGGIIEERYCAACNQVLESYTNHFSCKWQYVENNADGYQVYQCAECGATRLEKIYNGEKDENCQFTHTETYIYIVNGEEVYKCERSYQDTRHAYRYVFNLNGDSCADGYTVIETCDDCDVRFEHTSIHHNQYTLFRLDDNYEYCDTHNLSVQGCACGYNYYLSCNYESFVYNEELQKYVCEDCGLTFSNNVDRVEEGCALIETTTVVITLGGEEIYRYAKEKFYANHNFTNVALSVVDGVTKIVTSCDRCDAVSSTEVLSAEIKQHDDGCYYDYIFTPGESGTYTIAGIGDEGAVLKGAGVTLYCMVEDKLSQISSSYNYYYGHFFLSANLTAEVTYVYRIYYQNQSEEGTLGFAFSKSGAGENICSHNYSNCTFFSKLLDGSESCKDGALYGNLYSGCGCINYISIMHEHSTFLQESVDLKAHGACYGELWFYSCACGEESYVNLHESCAHTRTANEYYDEQGRLIQVETYTCSKCGLRYTRSYYTVADRENCKLTYYNSVVLNIGEELAFEKSYTDVEAAHDYEITGTLKGGEGSSCDEGVTIIYKCKVCEHEKTREIYYHESFEKQRIDLAELESVCGGYATLYECFCGKTRYLSLEHSLCDWGTKPCELWIENAITQEQYSINGYFTPYWETDSYIYVCAVTDPADKACAYKIRYAQYWLKDANSCKAYLYQTWQFGYNEETGEYKHQLTFQTGSSVTYHNYVDGSTADHTKYDCSDCHSYYYENWCRDDNGHTTKYEKIISNTLNNGDNKYYTYVEEYTIDANGNSFTSHTYDKNIYSDDSWSENSSDIKVYTHDQFADGGREVITSHLDSNGGSYEEKHAYVWYKGYQFTIYTYRSENGKWYRYDYTYNFGNGCVQTKVYTNSEGAREETTNDICKFYHQVTDIKPTCSQDGIGHSECVICGKHTEPYVISPSDHNWVKVTDNWYYCFACGLENANGISGDIIMEDLTDAYGNGENYVVGYVAYNDVEFTYYVSLIFADKSEIIVEGIEFVTVDGVRAIAFSKAAVAAWAEAKGYTGYDVRFSFVPVGSDSSFDYGLTFTETTTEIGTITDRVSFTDYIGAGETKSYTITPAKDGVWTFTSAVNADTWAVLRDAQGNEIVSSDDDGYNNNFKITYEMKAGETYTIEVKYFDSGLAGNVDLIFICEDVVAAE